MTFEHWRETKKNIMIRSGSSIGLQSVAYDLYRHLRSFGESEATAFILRLICRLHSPLPVAGVCAHVCGRVCAVQGGASRRRARVPASLCIRIRLCAVLRWFCAVLVACADGAGPMQARTRAGSAFLGSCLLLRRGVCADACAWGCGHRSLLVPVCTGPFCFCFA